MKICIVDDNPGKLSDIKEYVKKCLPDAEIHAYEYANDLLAFIHNHVEEIRANPDEWFVITDMQMPRAKMSRIEVDCGYDVLAEMQRQGLTCSAAVASSEPIDENRAKQLYSCYKDFIYYKVFIAAIKTLSIIKSTVT